MDFDFGIVEGGLAGLITAVASVGKYIHKRLTKDIDDLSKELKKQKTDYGDDLKELQQEHGEAMEKQENMLNKRIDRAKKEQKDYADKTAEELKTMSTVLTRLECLMETHYGPKRVD